MFKLKTGAEIKAMRASGERLAAVLEILKEAVRPGIKLSVLDKIARREIFLQQAVPSFLNYPGSQGVPFPAVLCASIDQEVIHGPANRDLEIKEGSILSLDLGLVYNGWQADMAVTVPVGKVSAEADRLIKVTKESLALGIRAVIPGRPVADIGRAIYNYVIKNNYSVLTGYAGHGIGRQLHEEPSVPNFPTKETERIIMRPGLVIAIEPMVILKNPASAVASDHWTVVTVDGSLGAHFEHTVAVTKQGHEVLTVVCQK